MKISSRRRLACALSIAAVACGAPRVTPDTHGTPAVANQCGRGVIVVESDYQSSNVSLLGFDGSVLSPSFASSSAASGGFALSLGGDVAPPWSSNSGSEIVLLDRTPKGVLHFIDVASANTVRDLPVGTGFSANPHDYLQLSEHKAYVARYDTNPNPGREPWDQGGDILLVDPALPAVIGRIDLGAALSGEAARFTPHPSRLVRVGQRVFVVLAAYTADYASATVSRLVELDPERDSIRATLLLDGLKGCDVLAASPDGVELAVACTGADLSDTPPAVGASGIALVDIEHEPSLKNVLSAATFGANPLGFGLDYAGPGRLLFGTLGYFTESNRVGSLDAVFRLDTASGAFSEVLHAEHSPFTLGDVRCMPACQVCFIADAERAGGSVLRFPLDDAFELGAPSEIRAETEIGLPPRYLGAF